MRFPRSLREIQSIGKRTREWTIDAEACSFLRVYGISIAGISAATEGFRFVRAKPAMSVLMGSISGRGRAIVAGEYRSFLAGMAYRMPAGIQHGYEVSGREIWNVCWVCYTAAAGQTCIIAGEKADLVRADVVPLAEAIRGLHREVANGAVTLQKLYACLIHEHCLRIAQTAQANDRLWKAWENVIENLGRNWTLEDLAREAGMSVESARIGSLRTTGRSPMKQVTYLRMLHAAGALASAGTKIGTIAEEVGYSDPFAFSTAFKRHMGMSPAAYRSRKRGKSLHINSAKSESALTESDPKLGSPDGALP